MYLRSISIIFTRASSLNPAVSPEKTCAYHDSLYNRQYSTLEINILYVAGAQPMMFCPKCGGFCEMDYEKNACVCVRCGAEVTSPTLREIRRKRPLMKV